MKVSHHYSSLSVYLRPAITAVVLAIISSSLVELAPAKPKDTIVTTITVAPWASGIAVSSDDTSVYVASILGQVSVIATSTDAVTSTISTGGFLDFIALAPGSGNLFATQYGPGPSTGESLLYDVNLTTQNTSSAVIAKPDKYRPLMRAALFSMSPLLVAAFREPCRFSTPSAFSF